MKHICYHGTPRKFDTFDINAPKTNRTLFWRDHAIFFTDSLRVAEAHAIEYPDKKAVITRPCRFAPTPDQIIMGYRFFDTKTGIWNIGYGRYGKKYCRKDSFSFCGYVERVDDKNFIQQSFDVNYNKAKKKAEAYLRQHPYGQPFEAGLTDEAQILECEIDLNNPIEVDAEGGGSMEVAMAVDKALATDGCDGAIVYNALNDTLDYPMVSPVYVVLSADQVKIIRRI